MATEVIEQVLALRRPKFEVASLHLLTIKIHGCRFPDIP